MNCVVAYSCTMASQIEVEALKQSFQEALESTRDIAALDVLEQEYFSRASGKLTLLMKGLGALTPDERKVHGQMLNALKNELFEELGNKRVMLEGKTMSDIAIAEAIDVTQPVEFPPGFGHMHPVTRARWDMEEVARSMGFLVEDGPELETDYYNFTAVNIPPTHPARDSMDTFYVKDHPHWVMRTHVSNMQVRLLKKYGAPIRAAYPGRCFRNEATDARHEHTFYQFETIVVDRQITFSDMVGVIKALLSGLFKKDVKVRFRPKFYPFVEPGVNGEMTCMLCDGRGCKVCKGTGWLEIFGAGLVHPHVLREGGLNPREWTGFAFGMGLSRLVMLKYGIEDTRLLQSGDMRFLEQF